MRVIKPYSLIAWFVALNTSLEGPKIGVKSARVYPEHPLLVTWGQKLTIGQLSDFKNGRTEGNILN